MDSPKHSLIPSFLYSSSSSPRSLLLDQVLNSNSNAAFASTNLEKSPSPSPAKTTTMVSRKNFLIASPTEPGKGIEMYSPAFYAACTVGGILSCGLTHMTVTPLDLVKCNMQIDPAKYKSISSGFGILMKEQGVKGFFRGWVPTLLGYSAQGACKFGFYEFFKKYYSDLAGPEFTAKYKTLIYLAGSASAEVIADIALCPFEAVKVRVQTQPGFARGMSDGFPKFVKSEGYGGLYKGLGPLWGRQIPYTMMKFASFETIVEMIYKYAIPNPKHECSQRRTKMDQIVNVNEFQELAKRALPKMYYDYFNGGAEDEHTVKENVEAFHRIMFRPRVLVDVRKIDMSTSVLGYPISAPIMIAPVALLKLAHPEGEIATARAAAACNTIMIVSYMSSCTIEEVASSCNAVRFLQIYVFKKHEIAQMVIRAEKAGFKAIVLTNAPRIGKREADIKNKMISPQLKNFGSLFPTEVQPIKGSGLETLSSTALDSSFGWKDIDWLRSITKLPILIKGILTREDALKAVEAGVDGIVVSNHGGRQLDYSPATITVLEEVVHVVRGRIPVLFDGGVRRGSDVFKALALGAQAVIIGRPLAYALAAKGEDGVKQGIEMLKNEFELTMALSGCPTIGDITRNHVKTEAERLHSML